MGMDSRGSGRSGGPASDSIIRGISFRHGLPESRIVQLAGGSMMGGPIHGGETVASTKLLRLERQLQIGGSAAWVRRVNSAFGAEALFDQEFRFLAVSKAGRTATSPDGTAIEFPESVFAGTRYLDLLPVQKSLLGDDYDGFDGLHARGFFEGRMLGAQIHLELNFGFHFLNCVMELWAVRTVDKGILAHSLIHPTEQKTPSVAAPGIEVFSVKYH